MTRVLASPAEAFCLGVVWTVDSPRDDKQHRSEQVVFQGGGRGWGTPLAAQTGKEVRSVLPVRGFCSIQGSNQPWTQNPRRWRVDGKDE